MVAAVALAGSAKEVGVIVAACAASGTLLIAGCRDAQSARQLGFVPVHALGAALEMARGRGAKRIGYLLAPPYAPLIVGT